MRLIVCLGFATILSCGCASGGGDIRLIHLGAEGSVLSSCKNMALPELSNPPGRMKRENVCVKGVLYVDSEYAHVFPGMTTLPEEHDIGISFSPNRDIRKELLSVFGTEVWVVGDLIYEEECWKKASADSETTTICAPLSRPIDLIHGTIIIGKKPAN